MPVPRVYHTITAFNDKIYVFGGTSDGDFSGAVLTIHVYTPPESKGVAEETDYGHPYHWELFPNYPNPFNPTTTIHYSLTKDSHVKLVVYNVLGEAVAQLIDGFHSQGSYNVQWDAQNQPSGLYLYSLEVDGFTLTK